MPLPNYSTTVDHQKTAEEIIINGHEYTRLYCICGYEYKVTTHETVDEFLYEIEYHKAIHPPQAHIMTWDMGDADYYLKQNIGWQKAERTRG